MEEEDFIIEFPMLQEQLEDAESAKDVIGLVEEHVKMTFGVGPEVFAGRAARAFIKAALMLTRWIRDEELRLDITDEMFEFKGDKHTEALINNAINKVRHEDAEKTTERLEKAQSKLDEFNADAAKRKADRFAAEEQKRIEELGEFAQSDTFGAF